MQKFIVGFSKARSPYKIGSRLIQWWINKPFSHTFLMFSFLNFHDKTIYEAVGKGLVVIPLNRFNKDNIIIDQFQIEVSDEQYFKILNKCNNAAGTEYGYLQNIGDVIAKIFRLKKNLFTDGFNCSEWVADCLIEKDPEAFSHFEDLNLVTPGDVYDYLVSKKYGQIS